MLEFAARKQLQSFQIAAEFSTGPGVTALFGRSGAGKSSIVQMIAGLSCPDEGRIVVNGRVLFDSTSDTNIPVRRRRVRVVFQDPLLFPTMTVRRNLLFGAGRVDEDASQPGVTLDKVCALLGIGHLLERKPASLSGGEAQRVAIGRTLLSAPDILLMDEPLAHLDGERRASILPWLDRLSHEADLPILYVSHSVDEVSRLADDLVLIDAGQVIASGPVGDIFGRVDLGPVTGRYEAGAVLTADVAAHNAPYALSQLTIGDQTLTVPAIEAALGDRVRLRIRARDVALATTPPQGTSFRNVIAGAVSDIVPEKGAYAEVRIDIGGQWLRARITRQAADDMALAPGLPVYCLVKSVAVGRSTIRTG